MCVNVCFATLRSIVELKDVEEIKLRLLEAEAESQDSDENQLKKVCALEDSAVRACVHACSGLFPLSGVHPPRWDAGRAAPIAHALA